VKKWVAILLLSIFSMVSTPRELWHHCLVHANISHCDNQGSENGFIDSPSCEVCNFQFQEFMPGFIAQQAIQENIHFEFVSYRLPDHNVSAAVYIALRGPPELS
jgi:hypothetical protein